MKQQLFPFQVPRENIIASWIGSYYSQPSLSQICRARIDQVTRRPFGMEFLFEWMQTFEIVKLVDMFIDEVNYLLNGWITGMLANSREGAQSQVETAVALSFDPLE